MLFNYKHYKKASKFLELYLKNIKKNKFKALVYKALFYIYSYKVYRKLRGGHLWQRKRKIQHLDGTKKK